MRVIPGSAVLSSAEDVVLRLTGSEGAFRCSRSAVKDSGVELTDTVPMDISTVVSQSVPDSDANCVTPTCCQLRSRGMACWSYQLAVMAGPGY